MNGNAVTQGIIIGAASTLVVTGLIFLTKFLRGMWLQRQITKKLAKTTIGGGLLGITATIHNQSQVEWRVRDVSLRTPNAWYKFNPIGDESDTTSCYAELFGQQPRNPEPTPHLSPLTGYRFGIPAHFMNQYQGPAMGLSIKIDYKSYSGRWKSVTVETGEWANALTQKTMEHYKQEFENGSLAAARVRFGMDAARTNWNIPQRRAS